MGDSSQERALRAINYWSDKWSRLFARMARSYRAATVRAHGALLQLRPNS
jgi:hypothetical protein